MFDLLLSCTGVWFKFKKKTTCFHSSRAVHRHNFAEPVGAAHCPLLPETQRQVQERRLTVRSWILRPTSCDVNLQFMLLFSSSIQQWLLLCSGHRYKCKNKTGGYLSFFNTDPKNVFLKCFYLSIYPAQTFLLHSSNSKSATTGTETQDQCVFLLQVKKMRWY